LTHKVAADLRPHLRAGESVGVLGAGEIGLLLYDSKPDIVRLVVGRLRCAVSSPESGGPFASAAVGVAHCAQGSAPVTPLVPVARENARVRALQIGTIS
jgi:GGDEF domain-containing protein